MKNYNSTSELKEFVSKQDLSDRNSNIKFDAKIELETAKNSTEIESSVMIRFEGFNSSGKLTITNSNLNPYEYPEEFEANWQTFKYKEDKYLEITGTHPGDKIGSYTVKITPISEWL